MGWKNERRKNGNNYDIILRDFEMNSKRTVKCY